MMNETNGNVFFIKSGSKFIAVEPKHILYVQACRAYCDVYLIDRMITLSIPLNRFLELSDWSNFRRISRSIAVNLIFIKEIYFWKVVLKNGIDLKITTNYLSEFYGSVNLIGGDAPVRVQRDHHRLKDTKSVEPKSVEPKQNNNPYAWSDDEIEVVYKLYMSIDRPTQYETFNKVYVEMQKQNEFPKRTAGAYNDKLREEGLLKKIENGKVVHPWMFQNKLMYVNKQE